MKFVRRLLICSLCTLAYPATMSLGDVFSGGDRTTAAAPDYSMQRMEFLQAKKAFATGDLAVFQELLDVLKDYPLVGYLRYDYLRSRLGGASDSEVETFIEQHDDSPISSRLRNAWLPQLASSGEWQTFLKNYRPASGMQGVALECTALQARYNSSDAITHHWLDEAGGLWLTNHAQPAECDPVFRVWAEKEPLTRQLLWQRVGLAMDKGDMDFAARAGRELGDDGPLWVKRWAAMYQNPAAMLDSPDYSADVPEARDIVRFGIKRLARGNAVVAQSEWQRIKPQYKFSPNDIALTERGIAVAAGLQRQPNALALLAAVDPEQVNGQVREWRVRAAIGKQDWPAVLTWIDAMNSAERDSGDWRYWRARALELTPSPATEAEKLGLGSKTNRQLAQETYADVARERTYYGFLANDRLARPYDIKSDPIPYTAQDLADFNHLPGIVRANEFFALGMDGDARREWDYTMSRLDQRNLELAAVEANRRGWYSKAIFTSAKAKHKNDLELRFPTLFRAQVVDNAEQNSLDPAWVYGVIRQESAFATDARSGVGAMGLMQLMPATGAQTAKRNGISLRGSGELLNPDKNIQLGSAYLRQVLDVNRDNMVLATASYNAGPGRVKQWLPLYGKVPADIWVEGVPFTETRNYIQQVLAFTTIFSQRLGQKVTPLSARMPDIAPQDE